MKVSYDFKLGLVSFNGGESFNLESLRRYVVNFHPDLIKPFFIRAVNKKFVYDYDGFFETVDTPFIRQYKKYLQSCYDDNIYPVEGISQKPEHLDAIFHSVKRQFVIKDHEFKLLQGELDRETGRRSDYPLLVFIGVSDMHGFPHSEISECAQVDNPSRLESLLEEFIKEVKEGKGRVYTKTHLVLNDLRSKFEPWVGLGDLPS